MARNSHFYRGAGRANTRPRFLCELPQPNRPWPQSPRRLDREYSLAAEREPIWTARPVTLAPYEGRILVLLADPAGAPLDLFLDRNGEQTLYIARFLRL
jgi:hypothetical protein